MKNKKVIAIALCTVLLTSGLGGAFVSYAQNEAEDNIPIEVVEENTTKAPEPNIVPLEPEISSSAIEPGISTLMNSSDQNEALKTGTKIYLGVEKTQEKDFYNFSGKDIEELFNKGYILQDIYEADELANRYFIDPLVLLQNKKEDKDLKRIKDDILKERSKKGKEVIKKKYEKEYKRLISEKMSEDEIYDLLAYIEINDLELTKDSITEYKSKGADFFKENINKTITKDIKNRYQLADIELVGLTDQEYQDLKSFSAKSSKSAKDNGKATKEKENKAKEENNNEKKN